MPHDFWAEAFDPLEMLARLRETPGHYPPWRSSIHGLRLNDYTARCLRAVGAVVEADLFARVARYGPPDEFADELGALSARANARAGGGYSQGRRPRRMPAGAQRARAALAALEALGARDGLCSPWHAALAVTRETQHLVRREQCEWLRCLFPNPLRGFVVAPDWLTATVVGLVRGIAAERSPDRLPILADALEDADCDDPDLLCHCRRDIAHGLHCWAIDSLRQAIWSAGR